MNTKNHSFSLATSCLFCLLLTASAATRYVDVNNAASASPYTSWATAACVIQDAVDAADPGDEILVTNGVYATGGRAVYGTMTNRVAIDKAVTVRSVNGANKTFIVGQGIGTGGADNGVGAIRCVYVGTNAVLSGFTLTNGHTQKVVYEQACGGGAFCDARGVVNNCTIIGNSADYEGGGACGGRLNNCIVFGNSANQGGGAYGSKLYNCTVGANSAYTSGGGVSGSSLYNCVVYYNIAPVYSNYEQSSFSSSCTTPLPNGSGNIDSEPLLASTTHVSSQSPCIGRGDFGFCSGVDIDGEGWQNPACMGADQYVPGGGGELSVAITAAYTNNIGTGFPVAFMAWNNGPVSATVWDFGDGVVSSNRAYVSHSWAAPGKYEVRLTGYNEMFSGGISATVTVQVAEREVYYVNVGGTIQEAIDAGTQIGRLVLVADGVYSRGGRAVTGSMQNRVVVPEGVEVRSVNGPLVTTIVGQAAIGTATLNGDGAFRCVYLASNAILSGFTLTGGHTVTNGDLCTQQSGGGAWCETSALITNCIFTGNSARYGGGGAYSGILNNCILTGNSATNRPPSIPPEGDDEYTLGGGVLGSIVNNCTLSGNSASYTGGGAAISTLNNCTLVGNSIAIGGYGGAVFSVMNNCVVFYNRGGNYGQSTLTFCCTTPLPSGKGNITNAPLFIDTNGWANLQMASSSPCINSGNNAYAPGTTDLAGSPRLVGGKVDIGAYEYQGTGSILPYVWLQQYGLPVDGSADYIDSDGDGFFNLQEWRYGTNPTNAASALRLLQLSRNSYENYKMVSWDGNDGILYFLERSTNLSATPCFQLVATNIIGISGRMSYQDRNAPSNVPVFYRLGVSN